MAKEKQTRRMVAMALAAAVTISSVPVVAFADENNVIDIDVATEGETVTVTEKTEDIPNITVLLEEGKTTFVSSESSDEIRLEGDVPESEDDTDYDYTEITETDRTVTATMGTVETFQCNGENVEISDEIKTNLDALNPEWNSSKDHVKPPTTFEKYDSLEKLQEALETKPDGYDFLYTGHGEDSLYGVDYGLNGNIHDAGTSTQQFQMIDLSNPSVLNSVTDETLKESLDIHTGYCVDLNTPSQKGYWYEIENLEDADYYTNDAKNHIRAIVTNGYWGTVGSEKDENGNDIPKTGSLDAMKNMLKNAYTTDEETGESIRIFSDEEVESLTEGEALTATQMAIWKYGNHYGLEDNLGFTSTTLDTAIKHTDRGGWVEWIYSNNGIDDPYGEVKYTNELELNGKKMTDEQVVDAKNRINAVYNYLIGLSQTKEESNATDVITEDKIVELDSMSMTVGEKSDGYAENVDDDNSNDVYNVSLNFALVVEPNKDKDDLIVKVIRVANDSFGNIMTEEIAKARLSGDATNDEGFNSITFDEDTSSYTLSGLELAENSNCEFNLKLEGVQYLQQGVYIYSSEIRNDISSQTFVGIAEGYKTVDVGMKVDLNFDVKEGTITEKHYWKKTSNNDSDNDNSDNDNKDKHENKAENDNEGNRFSDDSNVDDDALDDDVYMEDIDDTVIEESFVNDAEDSIIAETGDSNHMIAGFAGMLAALSGLFMLRKKKI